MAQLRRRYADFQQQGAELLAISSEDPSRGIEFKREADLPFPLLVDADCAVMKAYGVFHRNEPKGRSIARPSTFVIDAEGVIRWRYVGEAPSDRPAVDSILAVIPESERGTGDA